MSRLPLLSSLLARPPASSRVALVAGLLGSASPALAEEPPAPATLPRLPSLPAATGNEPTAGAPSGTAPANPAALPDPAAPAGVRASDWVPYFASGPAADARAALRRQDWSAAAAGFASYLERAPGLALEWKKDHGAGPPPELHLLQARFLEAYALARAGQSESAAARFDGLVADYPLLADHARLLGARALLADQRPGPALERARAIDAGAPLDAEARIARADAQQKLGAPAAAEEELRGYLAHYPASWREPEVRYHLAAAIEARAADGPGKSHGAGAKASSKTAAMKEARALYREVYVRFPTENWATLARDRLAALDHAPASSPLALSGPEHLARGLAFFDEMRNPESEAELRAALAATDLAPAQQCTAAYHLAQSVFKARDRPRAAALFDAAVATCEKAPKDAATVADLHAKSLYQGARCHAARDEPDLALARYERIEADHPTHSYADDARLREAEIYQSLVERVLAHAGAGSSGRRPEDELAALLAHGHLPAASIAAAPSDEVTAPAAAHNSDASVDAGRKKIEEILASIPARYGSGDQGGEALFRLAFDAFRRGALADSRRWLDDELRRYPREDGWWEAGRTLYWLARIDEAEGKPADARARYERAAREYPLSYYALSALNRLRESAPDEERRLVAELASPAPTAADLAFRFAPSPVYETAAFRRGVELARLGLGAEAKRELAGAGVIVPSKKGGARPKDAAGAEALWAASVLYDQAGEWALSHAIPRHVLTDYAHAWPTGDNAKRWRLSFPRGYAELIIPNAEKNGQPVALQFAIVREESAWNPLDESFANAIGLTQLTQAPAKRFAQGLPYSREALHDPVINVTIGARELGDVWKKAGGLAPLAIASYNAGEGAVHRWQRASKPGTRMDEFIEAIPYDETRGYTKRVLGSYFAYRWLYESGDPVPPLSQALPTK